MAKTKTMNQYALLTHPEKEPQAVNIGSTLYAELLLSGYKVKTEGKKREINEQLELLTENELQ